MSQDNTSAAKRTKSESPVADQVTEKAHKVVDEAGIRASKLESNMRSKAASAQSRAADGKDAAAQQMEQTMASIEEFIHEKPLAAAGIAFAAGYLVSKIFGR